MKFPIGFTFVHGYLTYTVVGYNYLSSNPYIVRLSFDSDDDYEEVEMSEWELEASSSMGV